MKYYLLSILLMAVVSYIPRTLPIVIVKSKLTSRFIRSFLFYVPFAVLGAMTFPNILYSTQNILSAVLGMCTALVLAYFEKNLMTVAVSAILMVYLSELLL